MRDTDLYGRILGIEAPWSVTDVELRLEEGEVDVRVGYQGSGRLSCPECGVACSRYDSRERRWRHLDTCQYRTVLVASVPRVRCEEHGVRTVAVPWGEPGSPFTALFEALVIDWLREASFSAVARLLGVTWDQIDGVHTRAVRRGLARRETSHPRRIGVDETSFQKRHEYVTVVVDHEEGVVTHVADGRGQEALASYYDQLPPEALESLEQVVIDMWKPYMAATTAAVPDAGSKIAFDKFHVAMHLNRAVDEVRRAENKVLRETGDDSLKQTKYLWLMHPDRLVDHHAERFHAAKETAVKTSRAWAIKELAMELWQYPDRAVARELFDYWYGWATRSQLAPIRRVAKMLKRHLRGVLNAIVTGITNARSEGINARIQWLKATARGYRNRERFRNAILFHLGGLDLYPASATHTNS